MELEEKQVNTMLTLYFLLGEKRPSYLSSGEDLLINILDRLSLDSTEYEIAYCYDFTPPSKKQDRMIYKHKRRDQLVEYIESDPNKIIVGMGWMAIEMLTNIGKTHISQFIGCRFKVKSFPRDIWFTYDPSAALYDPNLYVDIMGCVSAAIRFSGRQIKINTNIKPFEWNL